MSFSQPFVDLWLGRSLGDRQRYRIKKRIGGGGMGEVFLARDTLLGKPVALKLLGDKLVTGELRKRFEQEVAVCAALRSDHIIQVTDYGVTPEGYPFYVMEYLNGQTLRDVLRQEKCLSMERVVSITTQICAGLHLAHQGIHLWRDGATASQHVKVVHRDLKPDNIFLVPTALGEFVKILDFGIAKIRGEQAGYANLTEVFMGTYQYAAPEQLKVEKNLDGRADIYSLGIILYEMLSGTDPFSAKDERAKDDRKSPPSLTGVEWAVAHLTEVPIPLRKQPGCEHLPPELEAVVMRCLEKSPDQRFSSIWELNAALCAVTPGSTSSQVMIPGPVDKFMDADAEDSGDAGGDRPPPDPTQIDPPAKTIIVPKADDPPRHPSILRKPALLLLLLGAVAMLVLGFRLYAPPSPSSLTTRQETPDPQPNASQSATLRETATVTKTLLGHADTIWTLALSPDQQTLASGSFDKTIRLWDVEKGRLLRVLSGHTDAVRSVAFSRDGKVLVSGSGDKTIKIWDIQTGAVIRTLSGHAGPVWSVALSPDGQTLASGSYDGTIKIWNLSTGQLLHTLPEHYDSIWSVAISPDGQTLASCSYDGTIKIWNLQTGKLRRTLSGHMDAVRSIAISPDGQTLVSGSWYHTIKIWNLQTGELLRTLTGHNERVLSVAISPSGQTLASGSSDRTIKIWDLQTGKLLHTLTGHSSWVIDVVITSNGRTLVSGSKDKTVKVWQW